MVATTEQDFSHTRSIWCPSGANRVLHENREIRGQRGRIPSTSKFFSNSQVFLGNYRVQVFNPDGTFLYQFGSDPGGADVPSKLNGPLGITVDIHTGDITICELYSNSVQIFSSTGDPIKKIEQGFAYPYGLMTDRNGDLLVCDQGNDCLKFISKKSGDCWMKIGEKKSGGKREKNDFYYPVDTAFDLEGRILVVEYSHHRVQIFAPGIDTAPIPEAP